MGFVYGHTKAQNHKPGLHAFKDPCPTFTMKQGQRRVAWSSAAGLEHGLEHCLHAGRARTHAPQVTELVLS